MIHILLETSKMLRLRLLRSQVVLLMFFSSKLTFIKVCHMKSYIKIWSLFIILFLVFINTRKKTLKFKVAVLYLKIVGFKVLRIFFWVFFYKWKKIWQNFENFFIFFGNFILKNISQFFFIVCNACKKSCQIFQL